MLVCSGEFIGIGYDVIRCQAQAKVKTISINPNRQLTMVYGLDSIDKGWLQFYNICVMVYYCRVVHVQIGKCNTRDESWREEHNCVFSSTGMSLESESQ